MIHQMLWNVSKLGNSSVNNSGLNEIIFKTQVIPLGLAGCGGKNSCVFTASTAKYKLTATNYQAVWLVIYYTCQPGLFSAGIALHSVLKIRVARQVKVGCYVTINYP